MNENDDWWAGTSHSLVEGICMLNDMAMNGAN